MMSWSTINRANKFWINLLFLLIFLFSLFFQGRNILLPPFTAYDWRQWDTFAVVRNFRLEGMNPLNPRTNQIYVEKNKIEERFFLLDFPIYTYLSALFSYFLGISSLSLRTINIISGALIGVVLLKSIVELTNNIKAGVVAVILLNISPLFQFASISMQPDMFMFLFFCLGIYFCLKENTHHSLTVVFLSLSIIIKPYLLIMIAPLVIYRFVVSRDRVFLLYLAIPLMLVVIWWLRGFFSDSGKYWFSSQQWVLTWVNSWGFDLLNITWEMFRRISVSVLTIPVIILGFLGFKNIQKELRVKFILIILGFVLFLIIFIPGNFNHVYYQLPFLFLAYFMAGIGLMSLPSKQLAAFLLIAIPFYAPPSQSLYNELFKQHKMYLELNNWPFIQQVIPQDKSVILYNEEMSPVILNVMGRNGWVHGTLDFDCKKETERVDNLEADFVLIFKPFINRDNKEDISDTTLIQGCLLETTNRQPIYMDKNLVVFRIKE